MRWLERITDSMDVNLSKPWEIVEDRGDYCATVRGVVKSQTRLIDNNKSPQVQREISWAHIRTILKGKENYQESHKGLETVCFLQLEWRDLTWIQVIK